ncbi:DoxX family protein [Acidimicrobiia bacterium EGI L10123]|uniref:DoxX family protein n=1 Tax=Salinilacustrithrix flava TaxID=2957203 RepID=UPI003D7C1757|nr:DoxX family protein [Acidimicrobiia bacterium EGI L10123]
MDQDAVDLALLVFRCAIGAVMFAHGWNHVFRGGKIEGTAGWFASLGMKPGILHAWLASVAELAAGASLVLGLLTPLGAAAVVGTMTVALVTNHRGNGFFIFRPGEGWEYVMTLIAAGVALGVVGPGSWSLDEALDLFQPVPGSDGLWIVLAAGFGGALALLVTFWRPAVGDGES